MSNNSSSSNNNSSSNNSSFNQATGGSQGSSSSASNSTNSSFNNGMNVGMGVTQNVGYGNNYGTNNSSGTSNGMSVEIPTNPASDMRLKTDIKHVDQIDGVNLYEWEWKEDAPVKGNMNFGVMAQEVAQTHPDAVVTGDHGYLTVDYNKLGRAGQIALARAGA